MWKVDNKTQRQLRFINEDLDLDLGGPREEAEGLRWLDEQEKADILRYGKTLVGNDPNFEPFVCARCKRIVDNSIEDCPFGKEVEGAGTEPHVRLFSGEKWKL